MELLEFITAPRCPLAANGSANAAALAVVERARKARRDSFGIECASSEDKGRSLLEWSCQTNPTRQDRVMHAMGVVAEVGYWGMALSSNVGRSQHRHPCLANGSLPKRTFLGRAPGPSPGGGW